MICVHCTAVIVIISNARLAHGKRMIFEKPLLAAYFLKQFYSNMVLANRIKFEQSTCFVNHGPRGDGQERIIPAAICSTTRRSSFSPQLYDQTYTVL